MQYFFIDNGGVNNGGNGHAGAGGQEQMQTILLAVLYIRLDQRQAENHQQTQAIISQL